MILCSKMMLEWLGEEAAAKKIEDAVMQVLYERRVVTPDLGGRAGTTEVAEEISRKILGR